MPASTLIINWNPDPEIFNLFGRIPIQYYGLLWVIGIVCSFFVVRYQYRDKKISDAKFEPLLFYCFFGITIGARLGHCFFYGWDYYQHHLLEIILPFRILANGDWVWEGYRGLASHGGTLGLIIALWLYCRKTKMHYVDVLDMIAVATPICACFIRLANLMNSEIIGKATDVPWAFVFGRIDTVPRHPAQLYEAIAYFIFFLGMIYLYKKHSKTLHRGFFFGLCLTEIFTFRFFVEFLKENQVDFEDAMSLNMGQWLSIPFVLIGIYFMCFYARKQGKPETSKPAANKLKANQPKQ